MGAQPVWGTHLAGLTVEVAHFRVGPDRLWMGKPCLVSTVEYIRLTADRNPMPRIDLFPWLSRIARRLRRG